MFSRGRSASSVIVWLFGWIFSSNISCVVQAFVTQRQIQKIVIRDASSITAPSAPGSMTLLMSRNSSSIDSVVSNRQSSSATIESTDTPVALKSSAASGSSWDSFDYLQQWYPCAWAVDLPIDQPTQITLFDEPYAVVRHRDGHVSAVLDQCPHRAALLSEGRVTSSGSLQCAYHGWSFDTTTGACVDIPQAADATRYSRATCVRALPARVHQGMVWLWPGPPRAELPVPPTVPEFDHPDFTVFAPAVRDFPMIDWTLLVSNILDPDHGLFAHQAATFDWYVASPNHALQVEEKSENAGWTMTSRVLAVDKILARHRQRSPAAAAAFEKKNKKKKKPSDPLYATSTLMAPSTIVLGRRNHRNETNMALGFYVCPIGTGKSRFMSITAMRKAPFGVPRWLNHVLVNRFLDQDSFLVASQQPPVLQAEARGQPRSKLFAYQSPTDKSVRLIDMFWDATLRRAPNRNSTLLQNWVLPDRSIVLDRKTQHLDICPDSRDVVRNCGRIRNVGLLAAATSVFLRLFRPLSSPAILRSVAWPLLGLPAAYLAELVRKSFYFQYTKERHMRDLNRIPTKTWADV